MGKKQGFFVRGNAVNIFILLICNPRTFFKKVMNKLKCIHGILVVDKNTRRYIKHNKKVWYAWRNKNSGSVILSDFHSISQTNIAYSYFLNILAKKHKAVIKTFGSPEKIHNRALHKVYESFNARGHIITSLDKDQKRRMKEINSEIIPGLKTKQDIFNLRVMDIWVGVDIYESYLKDYNKPTIYLDDPRLFKMIEKGISLVIFWEDYFFKNKIKAVIASHDCYLCFDVACKVAYKYKVPVYFPNALYIIRTESPHTAYSHFINYRQMFQKLPGEERKKAITIAKQQLNRRLNGEIGVDMPYSTKSAFHPDGNNGTILRKSGNIKVLICSHCFYDNPQGYCGILFLDFYEWLNYLGKISERTNYDWYLKMHPDPLPGTLEIIQGILARFPKITLIPYETSFHQLVKEGLDFILTVYGSVGGECPLLGVPVINAGYNPRIAYDFNWHPKSLEEYEYYLLNLDKLHKDIKEEDIYEFYYMNHYYVYDDDFIFRSYKQFLLDVKKEEIAGPRAYTYFLEQWSDDKHQEIINNMQSFIDSGKRHYFSHGPE